LGILIDTGIWIGYFNKDDVKASRSNEIVEEIQSGKYGAAWTTSFIVDEVYTFLERSLKNNELAIDVLEIIMGQKANLKPFVLVYEIIRADCLSGLKLAKKYSDKRMSFTDLTSLVVIKKLGLSFIATYDGHFNGLIAKIE